MAESKSSFLFLDWNRLGIYLFILKYHLNLGLERNPAIRSFLSCKLHLMAEIPDLFLSLMLEKTPSDLFITSMSKSVYARQILSDFLSGSS